MWFSLRPKTRLGFKVGNTILEFSVPFYLQAVPRTEELLCFSSISVLTLAGHKRQIAKGKEKSSTFKIYSPSLMCFPVDLPHVIFSSDSSDCREMLLGIFFFFGANRFFKTLTGFHKHFRKAVSFSASDDILS